MLRALAFTACLTLLASGSAQAQATDAVVRWERIGHIADQKIAWLAVPPEGLAGHALYARAVQTDPDFIMDATFGAQNGPSPGATWRSQDAGKTWQSVTDAPGPVVLPAGSEPAFSLARDGVYRSTDDGATWTSVLSLAATRLVLSPAFQQDGTGFALGQDQLWRTTDQGATWTSLDPADGQLVVTAALSPSFGSDRTLFAGVVTARPNALGNNGSANVDSAGVLVSHDAGATWASLSNGLQSDDGPFQQVLAIGVSPDFAHDQTLVVTSVGPTLPPEAPGACAACLLPRVGTFASTDAGASWQLQDQPGLPFSAVNGRLSLSPTFPTDRTILSSIGIQGASPSSSICTLQTSTDGGATWQPPQRQPNGAGFCGLGITSAAGTTIPLAFLRPYYLSSEPTRGIYRSLDGGATWRMLLPPGDGPAPGFQADLEQRQAILPNMVLQATSKGDLWAYGGFAPCANQPALGFGQAWSQHPEWQESAGCPLGTEQPVQVEVAHDAANNFDTYWTDSVCIRIHPDSSGPRTEVLRAGTDCGGSGQQTLSGSLLSFANGISWLYVPTGPGQGLVITAQGVQSVSS